MSCYIFLQIGGRISNVYYEDPYMRIKIIEKIEGHSFIVTYWLKKVSLEIEESADPHPSYELAVRRAKIILETHAKIIAERKFL